LRFLPSIPSDSKENERRRIANRIYWISDLERIPLIQ
jgi:hypothetical protein